jgi:primosomal replication protein N''
MVLKTKLNKSDQQFLSALLTQLDEIKNRCEFLDKKIKQSENHHFAFDNHIFMIRSYSLMGYYTQVENTLSQLELALKKQMDKSVIEYECSLFVEQFQLLLRLIQALEKGDAKRLYQSYSPIKEQLYQKLQQQYKYEKRLLEMIAIEEEKLKEQDAEQRIYCQEKIESLKIRFQKCNSYTQKIEFQFEDLNNEE